MLVKLLVVCFLALLFVASVALLFLVYVFDKC